MNSAKGRSVKSISIMDKALKRVCNILRRDKAKGARLYVAELTWLLFLRYLDITEQQEEMKASALGSQFEATLHTPYRWHDWAAPFDRSVSLETTITNKLQGWKRREILENGEFSFIGYVNDTLFPYCSKLKDNAGASNIQKVVSEIFINQGQTVLKSDANLLDVLDEIHNLTQAEIDTQHMFPISQAFEGMLPNLGEKKNDGGQFFTPREVVRLIIEVVNPQLGGKVYDPCCGTGGFLIEAYKHMIKQNPTATQIEELKTSTFWGREDADEAIPILLANMVLHDIDLPRIWHGNTLTGTVTFGDLFEGAPAQFKYILTNPPFGSKEGKAAQSSFAYKSGKAQILFLQHIISSLEDGGTCGMVIDEGVLFHTKTKAYTQTKRKLLNDCDLFCIVSLPGGVFVNAGAGVKTDLMFFTKGKPTKQIWFYDMTLDDEFKPRKVNKGNPLEFKHFDDFLMRLKLPIDHPDRISERSWFMTKEEAEAKEYDIKAVNTNAPDFSDKRTSAELIEVIRIAQEEISKLLQELSSSS